MSEQRKKRKQPEVEEEPGFSNHKRQRYTKEQIKARDEALRARPFKSFGGEALDEARLRVAKRLRELHAYAAERGQGRGKGIVSLVKRKNCNIRRDAVKS